MALNHAVFLLLWLLSVSVNGVTSSCNVTCSTDYKVSVNCSCSGVVPTHPVTVTVSCRHEESKVSGSCDLRPPQSWCVMHPDDFDMVTMVETECQATVSGHRGDRLEDSDWWVLSNVVKPPPPGDVQVTDLDGFYNVTWNHDNEDDDCLTFRVRIRESKDPSQRPVHSLLVTGKFTVLDHSKLQPSVTYTVDVQTKMCPTNLYQGPWSEWSPATAWTTSGATEASEGSNGLWWLSLLAVGLAIVLLQLYFKKMWCVKKFERWTYIPRADEFFKPLDLKHGGNFKEWVKPAFSEYDYLRFNLRTPVASEKQHDVLQWNNEKQRHDEQDGEEDNNRETKRDGDFLQPHSDSLLFLQDGGESSHGGGRSTGHVSIHTVTLSGDDEDEDASQSDDSSGVYRDGENFVVFEERNEAEEGPPEIPPEHQHLNFEAPDEAERASLDSFGFNELSEDGYPHVDLDTIDSGFGECGSPGALDSNATEKINSDLFNESQNSNSNYVKQWMMSSAGQEDSETQ